jgi:uncharacterized protein (DUF885 family)
MLNIYKIRRLAGVILLLALCAVLLGGCMSRSLRGAIADMIATEGEEQFDQLMDELFADYVTLGSITMNYNLADPERLEIGRPDPPTFGETTTAETIRRSNQENQELSERLSNFRYHELRPDQQIVYDILARNLELLEVLGGNEDFAYYLGVFFPTAGLHVQLPIILAEFRFYTPGDIETYLRLLEDTKRYFDGHIEFERERARRGFFMTEANVDKVIGQCESFLQHTEDNLLIIVFNDKIDSYEGLSDERREQYKIRNRELVLGNVLPAYEALLSAMRELRGTGANTGGLAALPDGRMYAQAYLQYRTGTDMNSGQVETLLIQWMERISRNIGAIISRNPALWDNYINGTLGIIPEDTPERYLATLEAAISRDFPPMRPVQYSVREIHESLQEFMSPAFYLLPALDNFDDNVIYINPASETDNLGMLTTLAHEGYAGHLYQVVYYLQQSPHPIRTVLSNLGYTEGWATYAEMAGFSYAGLDEDEATLLRYSHLFDLLFISRIDLGVNALGWNIDRVSSYLRQFGLTDPEIAEDIFQTVIGYPLHFLPYSLGYLEMMSLREEAMDALRDDFDILEFHRFILDFGPAPFSLIQSHMQGWIREQPSRALAPAA